MRRYNRFGTLIRSASFKFVEWNEPLELLAALMEKNQHLFNMSRNDLIDLQFVREID